MRKPIKWILIGFSIFVAVAIVAVIIIFVGLFISAGVSAIKEVSTPETKQVEQAEEEVATEEIGQKFIYDGKKIVLTKYEIVPANTDKNLLWVYLYVENIDNVLQEHIYDMDFTIYHNGREDGGLIGFGLEEGRKYYSTGEYRELNPGEVCEGWIDSFIPTDWKAEDIEIHFKPGFGSYTPCIWKLEK